jgi:hypothetical protein
LATYTKQAGMISATTHSPAGSIVTIVPILSSIYSKNKPGHLKSSGTVMPNCSSRSYPSSTCCMPSQPTQSLETVLVSHDSATRSFGQEISLMLRCLYWSMVLTSCLVMSRIRPHYT